MKEKSWFLGIDLGTGSCKAVVVDRKGQVLSSGKADYPSENTHQKWQEQNPEALLGGLIHSVKEALRKADYLSGPCAGMSIGGALHSLIALDGTGKPLSGVLTWVDGRAVHQGEAIKKGPEAAKLYQQTGCPPHGMYPLYKIIWFRENKPDLFRKTTRFVSAKEYVFQKLTGEYIADYCLAAGSGLFNIHDFTWNGLSLDLAGIDRNRLSDLTDPRQVFRLVNRPLAGEMGVAPETPLVIGSADAVNSSLGAGTAFSHQATCMIGTSGALRMISPRPILDPESRSWCYAFDQDHWLVGGAINNGGVVLSWLGDTLRKAFPGLLEELADSFQPLDALAKKGGTGAGGLICLPFFAGERSPHWNLNARALFFGLTLDHKLEQMARAILEGIAFRMKSIYDVICLLSGDIKEIRASGGFTQSKVWPQIMASVLNQKLLIPSWSETSDLGTAFWAMLGTGAIGSLEEAALLPSIKEEIVPKEEEREIYEALYRIYGRLYQAVSPLFEETALLQKKLLG
jgi:gluconokinase